MTTKKTAAANAAEQIEAAVAAGKDNMETVVKASAEAAAKGYDQAVQATKEHVEAAFKAGSDAFKGYEDVAAFNKDNVDALVKSGAVLAKGAQDFNALWFDFAQASIEEGIAATKAILGCKTLQQVAEVQGDLVKGGYDKLVTESRKMSDMSVKVAENAAKPIAGRVNVAVEKFTKPLAT